MSGRYMEKRVDIVVLKDEKDIAGIGVKFVMSNYSQNSNNYFENMLGETANIRAGKKKYFQVLLLPERLPYYDEKGKITKWETITSNNMGKYIALSKDDIEMYLHTPIKTLLFVIKLPACDEGRINTSIKYKKYYLGMGSLVAQVSNNTSGDFGEAIVLNNYEGFVEKVVHYIKSI